MNKASKTVFEKHVASAYTGYDWSSLELDKSGKLSPHGKKTNLKCYESFSAQYPSVCPTFEYFKLLSRFFLSYHLNTNRVISSYVCPVCRSAPKKGICNSGKNGKYKGETCGSLECQTELRKRTNMEKGGNTCALHRSDVKSKVEASFQQNWGVSNAGQSEKIRNKWKQTNREKTGYDFQFQNPSIRKKIKETCIEKYGAPNVMCAESSMRKEIDKKLNSGATVRKRRETMKTRGVIGCKSSSEDNLYRMLIEYFPEVERQYGDDRYNFKCDFYVPINDLFIEYQGYFCHGSRPYNTKDPVCRFLVKKWEHRASLKYKKGKHAPFYSNAIKIYTELDVRKRNTARNNSLNWKEFFSEPEVLAWLSSLYPNTYYDKLKVIFKVSALRREYELIHASIPGYAKVPRHNKLVLQFQSRLFFKQELKMWKDQRVREKLVANRLKYIGKGWGELTSWEILRGFKISGMVKAPFSHFSQHWMRKFIEDYKVTSIYDPCGGWGHRLTACTREFPYIYNDIRSKVTANCKELAEFLGMENKVFYNEDAACLYPKENYDAVFTCPPYWNTEVYSTKGAENLPREGFFKWWGKVIKAACKKKPRLFAFVISGHLKKEMVEVCKNKGLNFEASYALGRSKSHFNKGPISSKEYLVIFTT